MAISETMKPALKTMVETEFQTVGYDPNAAAAIVSRGLKGNEGTAVSVGNVIPRVDLSAVLDRNILFELTTTEGKNSWQVRLLSPSLSFCLVIPSLRPVIESQSGH
jgi:hypothetical protein